MILDPECTYYRYLTEEYSLIHGEHDSSLSLFYPLKII